jgi:hypothetical protein
MRRRFTCTFATATRRANRANRAVAHHAVLVALDELEQAIRGLLRTEARKRLRQLYAQVAFEPAVVKRLPNALLRGFAEAHERSKDGVAGAALCEARNHAVEQRERALPRDRVGHRLDPLARGSRGADELGQERGTVRIGRGVCERPERAEPELGRLGVTTREELGDGRDLARVTGVALER